MNATKKKPDKKQEHASVEQQVANFKRKMTRMRKRIEGERQKKE